jgi:exodeoxyribonuclease-5
MKWSPQQDAALREVKTWLDATKKSINGRQVLKVFGFAGTGKTTLAKHFAEGVDGDVITCAFTGKAASVLRAKGFPRATTLHGAMYNPGEKSRSFLLELEANLARMKADTKVPEADLRKLEKAIKEEKRRLSQPAFGLNEASSMRNASLIIVDECFMLDEKMGQDLLSFGRPVLALGDPGQLDPVFGAPFFGGEPDVMHRQARDNPIIEMARIVREGEQLRLGSYGDSRVVLRSDINPELAMSADQLLVGRNKTRTATNRRARALKGLVGTFPLKGDKLVCLRNNHDLGLLNGTIWHAQEDAVDDGENTIGLVVRPEGSERDMGVTAHKAHFLEYGDELAWWERREAEEFDYGYALTVHKSQGSEWGHVMLFDEWFADNRKRWLYTGITRASERVTVVRMG